MPIFDHCSIQITDSRSILSFATTGSEQWPIWDRFLQIDGKPAYHIGNVCGTCAFFFERLEGATRRRDVASSIDQLNSGVSGLDPALIEATRALMPDGNYLVILHEILPILTGPNEPEDYFSSEQIETWGMDGFWNMPHHPKTQYYRLKSGQSTAEERYFEFLIPLFPQSWLNTERLESYRHGIAGGAMPTVLTLSVFDKKETFEADEDGVWGHACLAHYIIDGHHKAYAASLEKKPITALSFIALDQGVSTPDEARQYALDICARIVQS